MNRRTLFLGRKSNLFYRYNEYRRPVFARLCANITKICFTSYVKNREYGLFNIIERNNNVWIAQTLYTR